ncbi:MAG TPA: SSI family serine proteinase inhibitor [Sporichthyaceae bacterium]|jgi:hypothetical protein|nr:SSI family serine proteinase inhibitor [Sporichthyaceae bacterium]
MDARQLRVAVAGAATLLFSMGLVAVDARADSPAPATSSAGTSLLLTVAPQQGTGHSVTLTCPAGGTHPNAAGACSALNSAGGDIDKVSPKAGQMCPNFVRPVTASATGTYQKQPLSWSKTFNNACEMQRATNPIFTF